MIALDPDCVVRWKARTAAARDRMGELARKPELTPEEKAELDKLTREVGMGASEFITRRLDAK